ncbi:MAG: organomercurial lyase [Anaerolineales bacterium]
MSEKVGTERADLNEIIEAWSSSQKMKFSEDEAKLIKAMYPPLALGAPLTPSDVAAKSGFPLKMIEKTFHLMKRSGAEFDESGNLIGMALTLNPTNHKFVVDGQELYAWCAVDTLFLPGLVGKTADVESICPATGERIRLRISPIGIESVEPQDTVVSVVIPGTSAACEPGQAKGAGSASCQSMNYFISREAAEKHLGPDSDVAILDVQEASQLAQRVWVVPYLKALEPVI